MQAVSSGLTCNKKRSMLNVLLHCKLVCIQVLCLTE